MFDDAQTANVIGWMLLCVPIVIALSVWLQERNREYKQYVRWRKTHAAWKNMLEGESK